MQKKTPSWRHSSKVFHERAEEYDHWFDNSLLFAIEMAAIQSLDIRFSPPALEVGIGPGRFAAGLGVRFGIDPAFAPLVLAQKRGLHPCQAIAEALPFTSSSLGAVFLLFTLCFLESPTRFLQECKRILRPEAPLVIGFIPAAGAWGRHLLKKKEQGHPFYQSARFFTASQVQELLTENGFNILSSASTLSQTPEQLAEFEQAKVGMDEQAGFVIIVAGHDNK